ncbi:MAG: ABC transporter permease [Gammaproteobacteria bacterium]|nr:ABC transporter permease [Gammaproteobacteria bacterium]
MNIFKLAFSSLLNRKFTVLLTVFTIATSVALLLIVERVRVEARSGFSNTISGTDLIVGARTGSVQLLLYSVFRMGDAVNNISWDTYQTISSSTKVAWSIPLSLGDSHRGYRVLGTTEDYFKHYRYARTKDLQFATGKPFSDLYDAVIGAEVAKELNYKLNQSIVIAHGTSQVSFSLHDDKPFRIAGILAKTGTPVDRTVHVSLAAIEAIHIDWQAGVPPAPGEEINVVTNRQSDLTPKTITAFMLGLHNRIDTFQLQRSINRYPKEALLAILPGVTLQQLWDSLSMVEKTLQFISIFVVLTGLSGMLGVILSSLAERRREMAILRAIGARPIHIVALLLSEVIIVSTVGCLLGLLLLYGFLLSAQSLLAEKFSLSLSINLPSYYEIFLLSSVIIGAILVGCIPALRAYRQALADGLTLKI